MVEAGGREKGEEGGRGSKKLSQFISFNISQVYHVQRKGKRDIFTKKVLLQKKKKIYIKIYELNNFFSCPKLFLLLLFILTIFNNKMVKKMKRERER